MTNQYLRGLVAVLTITGSFLVIAEGGLADSQQLKKFSYRNHQYLIMSNGFVIRDNSLNIGTIGPDNKILPIVDTAEDKAAVAEANEGYAAYLAADGKSVGAAAKNSPSPSSGDAVSAPTVSTSNSGISVTFNDGAYKGDTVTLSVAEARIIRPDGTIVAKDPVGGKNKASKLGNFLKKEAKEAAITAGTMGTSGDIQGTATGNIEVTYPNGAKEVVPSDFSTVNTSGTQKLVTTARYRFGPSAVEISAARKVASERGHDIDSGFLDRIGRYGSAVVQSNNNK